PGAALLVRDHGPDEPRVCAVAYRLAPGPGQRLEGDPVVLTDRIRDGLLVWDVPPGCWRVFFVRYSRRGMDMGGAEHVDFLRAASSALQIEAVYEPHFARYAKYFGNVLAGFFSDEPQFGNVLVGAHRTDRNKYHYGVGEEGLALPASEELLARMSAALGEDASARLPELWYEGPRSPGTRLAYMDALTTLFRDNFSRPIGDWCRARGVEWIGHVIEDMDAHARMGYGPGHYFRAVEGMGMGGCDVVLHQVLPGFADHPHTASALGGSVDPDFFHCVLPKLASSIAHQRPHMQGRAMCEVFGAYGWGEGAPTMRWLLDFLLVRGINHFSPHAFAPDFPNPDCPPHFGAGGRDPQFEGFSALMRYANRAAHLLSGGRHVATAALLYHAEGEWMSGVGRATTMSGPARALLEAHLDFDIVCADTLLGDARVEDGRLRVADETFGALVVPFAPHLPPALLARLSDLRAQGLPILFAGDEAPHGVLPPAARAATPLSEGGDDEPADPDEAAPSERGLPAKPGGGVLRAACGIPAPLPLSSLADAVRAAAGADVVFEGGACRLVRHYHVVRDGRDAFFFFNESPDEPARATVRLPPTARGAFARLRLLEDAAFADQTDDGAVALDLLPGQSELLVFGGDAGLPPAPRLDRAEPRHPVFRIETADAGR
ncbi:MAG: hypothetical protein II839_09875, partial [Kiritimatiellae bacterium]|nr:hypothetical protein [Kiritimatiellia bacterium]